MDEVHKLIIAAQNGDEEAFDKVINDNIGLVWSIVKKFSDRNIDRDDLFQTGAMGLVKAVKKFDTLYNVKFSTYAVPVIIGEIKRLLRDDGIIKVSRGLKETAYKAFRTRGVLRREKGREPTLDELAEYMNIDREILVTALDSMRDVESIDRKIETDKGREMNVMDTIAADSDRSGEIVENIVLNDAIDKLDKRERDIIKMRYEKEMTQSQVAEIIGVSQVQVSRLEKRILKKLRSVIEN